MKISLWRKNSPLQRPLLRFCNGHLSWLMSPPMSFMLSGNFVKTLTTGLAVFSLIQILVGWCLLILVANLCFKPYMLGQSLLGIVLTSLSQDMQRDFSCISKFMTKVRIIMVADPPFVCPSCPFYCLSLTLFNHISSFLSQLL